MLDSQVLNQPSVCLKSSSFLQIQKRVLALELELGGGICKLDGFQSASDTEHGCETSQKDANQRFDFDLC